MTSTPPTEPGAVALRRRLLPGNPLHNILVMLGGLGRVPVWLLALVALAFEMVVAGLFHRPGVAAGILAGATGVDLILLMALPRLGRSFGPVQGPLALFTAGRIGLALPLALLPAGWGLMALAALQSTLVVLSLWGHLVAPFRVRVERVELPVLPSGTGPLRLVFLSDLHVERRTVREERVLSEVDRLAPDLVLFGGDVLNLSYVDDPRAQRDAVWFLRELAARHPLVAVLGNPTVEDRSIVPRLWREVGLRPLDGVVDRRTLEGVDLAVFGLPASMEVERDGMRLAELLASTPLPDDTLRLLLYHLPDLAGRTPGVDLYLCGHTHGGQIRLPGLGPLLTGTTAPRRLVSGTHRLGGTWIHTGRGLGLEGLGAPRMRFFCPPEITLLVLTDSR